MKLKNIKNKKRPRMKKISQSYENRKKSAKLAQKRRKKKSIASAEEKPLNSAKNAHSEK